MTTRQIRDLAIRILGLYYLAHAIISLPQILGWFSLSGEETAYVTHKYIFACASLIPVAMYFAVAYMLLFKTRAIMALLWPSTDEDVGSTSTTLSLPTWVGLIGLFYLIGSVGDTVSGLWIFGVSEMPGMGSHLSYKFLPDLITMALAIICIVKSRSIAEYLKKKTE